MHDAGVAPLVALFVGLVAVSLVFGGLAMADSRLSGGIMGSGWLGGLSWLWIPAVLTLGAGGRLGWVLFGRKGLGAFFT